MDMYQVLRTKPHSSKHLARYVKFIQTRRPQLGPIHNHHICPKAVDLFPEYGSFKDHPWNKASLTPREHYVAHLLLWKTYGGSQAVALQRMTPQGKRLSRVYESSRIEAISKLTGRKRSDGARAKMSAAAANRRKRPCSEEAKAKISASNSGRKHSEEFKAMRAAMCLGKTLSQETKAKISAKSSGRTHSAEARAKISASMKARRLPVI